jgi:hypothetical protein
MMYPDIHDDGWRGENAKEVDASTIKSTMAYFSFQCECDCHLSFSEYISTYYAIETKNLAAGNVSLPEMLALMKQFITHCSALDLDKKFCESWVRRFNEE